jgi:hypothetical protein
MMDFMLDWSASEWVLYAACLVINLCPWVFIAHCRYDHGIVGLIGLGWASFFAFVILVHATGAGYSVDWSIVLMGTGLAIHQAWQVAGFLRRIAKEERLRKVDPEATIPQAQKQVIGREQARA